MVDLDGWRGMVGHNWGAEHAERWIWMHGAGFEGHDDAWLDAGLGRIKVGPLTTPWIANGVLHLDGERHRLGGPEKARKTDVHESPDRCDFALPGSGHHRPGHGRRTARGLRRLDLRRPRRIGAQHRELLDRRHDADRLTTRACRR